ncbi:MAG: phosphatidate cytidylyltransferase [Lachnospiraceae bacterium]|nr:phosphatidate cytidylyltransferase [Lachnospiraceae bacterium]
MFLTRLISGIFLILILGITVYAGGFWLWILLFAISFFGYREFCKAIEKTPGGEKFRLSTPEMVAYVGMAAYEIILFVTGRLDYLFFSAVGVMLLLMALYVFLFPAYDSGIIAQYFFGFCYTTVLLSFLYLLRQKENGLALSILVFACAWGCDTFAYLSGRAFGKHKLAPILSPKKSVEGAIGGTLGAALLGGILAALFSEVPWKYALIAGGGAIFSQVGDLFASGIKREKEIKDYGNLIPGHGGILDRFDSCIFVTPVIYFFSELL